MAIRWNVTRTIYVSSHPLTPEDKTIHSAVSVAYPEGNILLSELQLARAAAKRHGRSYAGPGVKINVKPIYNVGMTSLAEVIAYWD